MSFSFGQQKAKKRRTMKKILILIGIVLLAINSLSAHVGLKGDQSLVFGGDLMVKQIAFLLKMVASMYGFWNIMTNKPGLESLISTRSGLLIKSIRE